ncbi:MAG: hypothetical protein LC808_44630 [Actinobacteria bacterium]|nr:hypothetical protein [Actinomycetota bacterium]
MRQLGDLSEARRHAVRIIELRSGDRTRSRAFGQLILCTVLIDLGKPDEACALARDVLHATQSLSSFLVIQELRNLRRLLQPHRADKVVAGFLDYLDEVLRERMWLYQWLSKDGESQPAGRGEGA